MIYLTHKPFEQEDLDLEVIEKKENHIVLYNDEVNTFDHVIDSLIAICSHDPMQAEQCSYIVHHRGKCSVKDGFLKNYGLCAKPF